MLPPFVIKYLVAPTFVFLGLLCIRISLKQQTPQDIVLKKNNLPLYGKGSKMHIFYIGIGLIFMAFIIFFNT
jgi:hypothetical protein